MLRIVKLYLTARMLKNYGVSDKAARCYLRFVGLLKR